MIKDAIIALSQGQDLSCEVARGVMDEIMTGTATPVQMGAYLAALTLKGETIEEITASANGMRAHCVRLLHDNNMGDVLEIVGTGGDLSNTFNISTAASIIAAAAGIPVAKHGNRSASGKCGSADVLEAVGVKIELPPAKSLELLEKIGICFMFAPNYHIAMKHVAPVRRELGIRTVFNLLGPLTNPAGAKLQLMGVYDKSLIEPLAQVLMNLGVTRAMVVRGEDGIDEISLTDATFVCEIRDGSTRTYTLTPEEFGLTRCTKSDLEGGDSQQNAAILRVLLSGEKSPKRDAAILNAGAAMYVSGRYDSIREAVDAASKIIDSGAAAAKLEAFIEGSNT